MTNLRAAILLLAAPALTVAPATAQFASVRVQVIDVGQADGILIRTPNSKWILIDAGQDNVLADSLGPHFGVDRFAIAFASHRHKDHIGAMDRALGNLPADLFVGDTTEYDGGTHEDSLRILLREQGVPVRLPEPDTFDVDGVRFIVLPRLPVEHDNDNNNSVVVRMEFGEFSMLFTGDAEVAERDFLLQAAPELIDADVLKASHHGSHNGTSELWIAAVSPEHVVISAGVHRGFRHPHGDAVENYEDATNGRLHCTNRHGTVRIYGFPDGRIRVFRQRQDDASCTFVDPGIG